MKNIKIILLSFSLAASLAVTAYAKQTNMDIDKTTNIETSKKDETLKNQMLYLIKFYKEMWESTEEEERRKNIIESLENFNKQNLDLESLTTEQFNSLQSVLLDYYEFSVLFNTKYAFFFELMQKNINDKTIANLADYLDDYKKTYYIGYSNFIKKIQPAVQKINAICNNILTNDDYCKKIQNLYSQQDKNTNKTRLNNLRTTFQKVFQNTKIKDIYNSWDGKLQDNNFKNTLTSIETLNPALQPDNVKNMGYLKSAFFNIFPCYKVNLNILAAAYKLELLKFGYYINDSLYKNDDFVNYANTIFETYNSLRYFVFVYLNMDRTKIQQQLFNNTNLWNTYTINKNNYNDVINSFFIYEKEPSIDTNSGHQQYYLNNYDIKSIQDFYNHISQNATSYANLKNISNLEALNNFYSQMPQNSSKLLNFSNTSKNAIFKTIGPNSLNDRKNTKINTNKKESGLLENNKDKANASNTSKNTIFKTIGPNSLNDRKNTKINTNKKESDLLENNKDKADASNTSKNTIFKTISPNSLNDRKNTKINTNKKESDLLENNKDKANASNTSKNTIFKKKNKKSKKINTNKEDSSDSSFVEVKKSDMEIDTTKKPQKPNIPTSYENKFFEYAYDEPDYNATNMNIITNEADKYKELISYYYKLWISPTESNSRIDIINSLNKFVELCPVVFAFGKTTIDKNKLSTLSKLDFDLLQCTLLDYYNFAILFNAKYSPFISLMEKNKKNTIVQQSEKYKTFCKYYAQFMKNIKIIVKQLNHFCNFILNIDDDSIPNPNYEKNIPFIKQIQEAYSKEIKIDYEKNDELMDDEKNYELMDYEENYDLMNYEENDDLMNYEENDALMNYDKNYKLMDYNKNDEAKVEIVKLDKLLNNTILQKLHDLKTNLQTIFTNTQTQISEDSLLWSETFDYDKENNFIDENTPIENFEVVPKNINKNYKINGYVKQLIPIYFKINPHILAAAYKMELLKSQYYMKKLKDQENTTNNENTENIFESYEATKTHANDIFKTYNSLRCLILLNNKLRGYSDEYNPSKICPTNLSDFNYDLNQFTKFEANKYNDIMNYSTIYITNSSKKKYSTKNLYIEQFTYPQKYMEKYGIQSVSDFYAHIARNIAAYNKLATCFNLDDLNKFYEEIQNTNIDDINTSNLPNIKFPSNISSIYKDLSSYYLPYINSIQKSAQYCNNYHAQTMLQFYHNVWNIKNEIIRRKNIIERMIQFNDIYDNFDTVNKIKNKISISDAQFNSLQSILLEYYNFLMFFSKYNMLINLMSVKTNKIKNFNSIKELKEYEIFLNEYKEFTDSIKDTVKKVKTFIYNMIINTFQDPQNINTNIPEENLNDLFQMATKLLDLEPNFQKIFKKMKIDQFVSNPVLGENSMFKDIDIIPDMQEISSIKLNLNSVNVAPPHYRVNLDILAAILKMEISKWLPYFKQMQGNADSNDEEIVFNNKFTQDKKMMENYINKLYRFYINLKSYIVWSMHTSLEPTNKNNRIYCRRLRNERYNANKVIGKSANDFLDKLKGYINNEFYTTFLLPQNFTDQTDSNPLGTSLFKIYFELRQKCKHKEQSQPSLLALHIMNQKKAYNKLMNNNDPDISDMKLLDQFFAELDPNFFKLLYKNLNKTSDPTLVINNVFSSILEQIGCTSKKIKQLDYHRDAHNKTYQLKQQRLKEKQQLEEKKQAEEIKKSEENQKPEENKNLEEKQQDEEKQQLEEKKQAEEIKKARKYQKNSERFIHQQIAAMQNQIQNNIFTYNNFVDKSNSMFNKKNKDNNKEKDKNKSSTMIKIPLDNDDNITKNDKKDNTPNSNEIQLGDVNALSLFNKNDIFDNYMNDDLNNSNYGLYFGQQDKEINDVSMQIDQNQNTQFNNNNFFENNESKESVNSDIIKEQDSEKTEYLLNRKTSRKKK